MAMNLEAVLRIAAKVVGLEEVTKLERAIGGSEKTAKDASAAFSAVAGSKIWQVAAAGATAFLGGMVVATKAAMDFESSMADVRKVVDGLETPAAFQEMQMEILELSNTMPIAASGIAEIYAAAGQSGIAKDELRGFAELVGQVSVAFDMTAQEAGTALAKMKVALDLTTPELRALADAMNYVSDNTGASAKELVDFMSRSGAVGQLVGLNANQTMAFGAAMIQAGVQTEVAATSFNNMVKALSAGPSMTERQVDALRRLGYSMADAKQIEADLSRAIESESRNRVNAANRQKDEVIRLAQEQSDRRIEIARDETDKLSREINRRYRDELRSLQDGWEDQAKAQEDALRDRAEAQIKALQRQERAEIDQIQKAAQARGQDATAMTDQIRDAYEARIDAIRDQLDRELTVQRRIARDQQQAIRDQMDDRKEVELNANTARLDAVEEHEKNYMEAQKSAAEERFKAVEEREKQFVENAKAEAKKTGESLASASKQGFADRLQADAIGTITEVLARIRNVPESQRVSIIRDLFGDEARGLPSLINNLGALEKVIGLATDTQAQAASVAREYGIRIETAAAKVQMFWNRLNNTAILIGTSVLPALEKLADVLTPVLKSISKFVVANPELTGFLVAVGATASAVVLALPVIAAFLVSVATVQTALAGLAIGATIAGWAGAVVPAIVAIKAAFVALLGWLTATLLPGLIAFFSGPIGWTVLAVAAVVAMAIAFREPLMNFVSWLWNWTEFARAPFVRLWDAVVYIATTAISKQVSNFKAMGSAIAGIWNGAIEAMTRVATGWGDGIRKVIDQQVSNFKAMGTEIVKVLTGDFSSLQKLADNFQKAWAAAGTFVAENLKNAFRGVLQFIASQIKTVAGLINRLIGAFNALPGADIPLIPTLTVPQFATGGTVDRPTLAMVGEGGEREYIIPESKMQAASSRFLGGARGGSVIPSSGSTSTPTRATTPQINIRTGPVMQQQDGSRWVSVEDFQRGLQQMAELVVDDLRRPEARLLLGTL